MSDESSDKFIELISTLMDMIDSIKEELDTSQDDDKKIWGALNALYDGLEILKTQNLESVEEMTKVKKRVSVLEGYIEMIMEVINEINLVDQSNREKGN